jgi:predicted nucleotidyltransferase component of viral defense system
VTFSVYPLDEIGAVKLRCIIQRMQCRDLYDLLRLTGDMGVSFAEIRPPFERKTRAKELDPSSFRGRFEDRIERYKPLWNNEMSEHLVELVALRRRRARHSSASSRAALLDT